MPTTRTSPHPVAETAARIVAELERRSITLFAKIDHAAGARAVGLSLGDEVVLVFGNPQAGTPLMQANPLVGLDLPLRILVCERAGETVIAYHDPAELEAEYGLADRARLEAMGSLLAALAAAAA